MAILTPILTPSGLKFNRLDSDILGNYPREFEIIHEELVIGRVRFPFDGEITTGSVEGYLAVVTFDNDNGRYNIPMTRDSIYGVHVDDVLGRISNEILNLYTDIVS
jgi:hypothetical protein